MRRAAGALGWAVVVLAAGCEQPRTEFVVRVDSEVAWGADQTVQSVVLTVRRGGATGPLRSARTTALGAGGERLSLPLYVGVIAVDNDVGTPVWIEALGCGDPNGCEPATARVAQRAVVRFTRGRTEEVPLLLASACVGMTCAFDERCGGGGRCEPATRAQATVRPFIGTDAGTAASLDATVDAGGVVDAVGVDDVGGDVGGDVGASMDVTAADVADAVGLIDTSIGMDAGVAVVDAVVADSPVITDTVAVTDMAVAVDLPMSGDTGPISSDTGRSDCPVGMRLIPAGMFLMGDASPRLNAAPVHGVRLSAFCMDETEVTVAAFRSCVTAGSCTPPNTASQCLSSNWMVAGRDDHPVNCVTWEQSRAYCQWRGGDLPTEAQWEYAARGTDGRLYPWGSAPVGPQLCWSGGGSRRTNSCAVRSFPAGDSPFGLSDMSGNVYEWTLDWFAIYSGSASSVVLDPAGPGPGSDHIRVFRGGGWLDDDPIYVRASLRAARPSSGGYDRLGFRCAHTAP